MDPSEPRERWRFFGVANLLTALRNLGLLGHAHRDSRLAERIVDDGQPIPVRSIGQGPAVVLVHGLGCSHRHWMPVATRLARAHRVVLYDARGHGVCRPHNGNPITLTRLATDIHELFERLALQRVALVGHSMGALTALQYLQQYGTARIAALGLVDQSPRIVTDDAWRLGLFGGCSDAMLRGLIAGARKDLAGTVVREVEAAAPEWVGKRIAANAPLGRLLRQWLQAVDASLLLDLAESLADADFRTLVPRLDVPLLVVLGGRSAHYGGVPLESWYRNEVPHAEVLTYARSGHSPHVAEAERFSGDLARFLADHA